MLKTDKKEFKWIRESPENGTASHGFCRQRHTTFHKQENLQNETNVLTVKKHYHRS